MATQLWQRLRMARRNADLTQESVAKVCGVSRAAIAQWEANKPENRTVPTLENLRRFAQATKVPLDWLMSDNGEAIQPWEVKAVHRRPPTFTLGQKVIALADEAHPAGTGTPGYPILSGQVRQAAVAMSATPAGTLPDIQQGGKHFIFATTIDQIIEKLRAVEGAVEGDAEVHLVLVGSPLKVHTTESASQALSVVVSELVENP